MDPIAWLEPGTDRPLFDLAEARALARHDPVSVRWADEHYQQETNALVIERILEATE